MAAKIQVPAGFKPVPASVLKQLSKPNPALSMAYIAADWVVIAGVIWFTQKFWNPALYLLAVMLIGNRQHSLAIQMHDGSHSLISRKRWLNNFVAEVFCAWPLFFRMAAYRENHLLHHSYTNTDRDPDFRPERFPTKRIEVIRVLLMDLVGLGAVEQLRELKRLKKDNVPRNTQIARVAFYLTGAALITYFGGWQAFGLYWAVPIFTWLRVALRVRAIADHAGVQDLPHPFNTRTVVPNWFDKVFLAPRNSSYHLGHHFYAAVPCYRLKELHAELMKNELVAKHARITSGFWRVLGEFPSRVPRTRRATRASRA